MKITSRASQNRSRGSRGSLTKGSKKSPHPREWSREEEESERRTEFVTYRRQWLWITTRAFTRPLHWCSLVNKSSITNILFVLSAHIVLLFFFSFLFLRKKEMVYLRTLSPLKMFIIIFFFSLNLSCTCLSGLCDCSKAVGSRRRTGHGRHFLPRDTAKFSFFQRHREKMSQKKLFFCLKKKKFFLALPVACQKGTEEKIYILSDIQHTHTQQSRPEQ